MAKKKNETVTVEADNMEMGNVTLHLRGVTPLLVNQFPEKARREMMDKMSKKAKAARPARDFLEDYFGSMHIISGDPRDDQDDYKIPLAFADATAVHGFASAGFKESMVRAGASLDMVMTTTRQSFGLIEGQTVPIKFGHVVGSEEMVRIQRTTDIRIRAEYHEWETAIRFWFLQRHLTLDALTMLARLAGQVVGVGEWRPQTRGTHGQFELADATDYQVRSVWEGK